MIALWMINPGSHNLERWGYVPDSFMRDVPPLERGQRWNLRIPYQLPANAYATIPREAVARTFAVTLVWQNRTPHWVIVSGAQDLSEHEDVATFPRAHMWELVDG